MGGPFWVDRCLGLPMQTGQARGRRRHLFPHKRPNAPPPSPRRAWLSKFTMRCFEAILYRRRPFQVPFALGFDRVTHAMWRLRWLALAIVSSAGVSALETSLSCAVVTWVGAS